MPPPGFFVTPYPLIDMAGLYKPRGSQAAAMTAQLTTITHSEPGTPDYAIADPTSTSPFGFTTQDEALTLLKVVANLQARVAEMEAIVEGYGMAAAN